MTPVSDAPSTAILAGQLAYLFEDDTSLADASDEDLAARLNRNDRFARAREKNPIASDAEVGTLSAQLDDRITAAAVRAAREELAAR
jgi:hypothetical protein